ncbi:SGNH hydrolase [Rhizodiscina lignyota]|uniref:SGNH hydrolase n=1 Tax=Rhizodiscina lignyota TaxID=1504668 RepID=A0A9P4IFS1_9PEZI|nr:SGNH hydrolase [Rhizodiscina lignyota]
MSLYEKFLLFGDSITQDADGQDRGFAWAAALRGAYVRKLEVLNRGMSGYNTDQALKVLERVVPNPEYEKLRFMAVFYGANDACWPTDQNNQSVPIPQYTGNLIKIFTHPLVKAHNARLIIITPPPVNEYQTWITDQAKGYTIARRSAEHTKEYADAAREVGKDLNIPVLDLWRLIMLKAGWKPDDDPLPGSRIAPENPILIQMLRDGLHLSPAGYKVLHEGMMELIRRVWPDQVPSRLPNVLPNWNDRDGWNAFTADEV